MPGDDGARKRAAAGPLKMENLEIAAALSRVAELLQIQGANRYRIRAYRNAARVVAAESRPLKDRLEAGEALTGLPGIGREMAAHIEELVSTGGLALLGELSSELPPTLADVVSLPGIGPRKAELLWRELDIETIDDLAEAASRGRIAPLEGFGRGSQARILGAIRQRRSHAPRVLLSHADDLASSLVEHLRAINSVREIEVVGSVRRRCETVGDLNILVVAVLGQSVVAGLIEYPGVTRVEAEGESGAIVVLESGLRVDLRVVPERAHGAAMIHFTGSREHNLELSRRAIERGLEVSEHGLLPVAEEAATSADAPPTAEAARPFAGSGERAVYRALGLPWISPELRENRGEIVAAERGELPDLLELTDLKGDLQMHTTWSDGRSGLEDMVSACEARGYEYLAITDHSPLVPVTNGLDARRLRLQWREIERVQAAHPGIRIFKSQEVDVRADGSLDQTDEVLEQLDLVVAAIHTSFGLPASRQTRRILDALENTAVRILAHPTGRKIGRRPAMELDLEEVLHCAAEHGVALELNALPARLDLADTHLMRARELGVEIVISTDAHSIAALDLMRYGVDQARRAWLEAGDVVNTRTLAEFERWLDAG